MTTIHRSKRDASQKNSEWQSINWHANHRSLYQLQKRIYNLSLIANNIKTSPQDKRKALYKMRYYQGSILKSKSAKLLAVRKVTTDNSGRKTAGVDKLIYITPEKKMTVADKLNINGKASPIRRVKIPKLEQKTERLLGIPTMIDRAKQALVVSALEPEWEAKFEPNSYGFRPGRRTHDAVEAIFNSTRGTGGGFQTKFILNADLKGCFDNIDHDYLMFCLNNGDISLSKVNEQIKAWLKAGIMEGFNDNNIKGIIEQNTLAQGAIISPLLANIALHGAETMLKQWAKTAKDPRAGKGANAYLIKTKYNNKADRANALGFVRYADDFVVINQSEEVLYQAKEKLIQWFNSTSKLTFNDTKTSIKPISQGFNFVGFFFISIVRQGKAHIKIVPSKNNVKNHLESLREVIQNNKAVSSYVLISKLRPIILGWSYYYRYCECNQTFRKVYYLLFQKLRAWVFRRDRRNGRMKSKEKYFPSDCTYKYSPPIGMNWWHSSTQRQVHTHQDNWILVGQQKSEISISISISKGKNTSNHLIPHSWVLSEKYIKVKGSASPYDGNLAYWNKRNMNYGGYSPSQSFLLAKQNWKCALCKQPIQFYDIINTDPIDGKISDCYSNLQILHHHCHRISKQKPFKKGNLAK